LVYLKSKQQAINGGNPKNNNFEMKSRFGRCWRERERGKWKRK